MAERISAPTRRTFGLGAAAGGPPHAEHRKQEQTATATTGIPEGPRGKATPFARVVCCSGHMIDRHDRATPRFPSTREHAVRAAMAAVLDRWGIGDGDLAVSGGACGADILFAELCLERGAWVRLLIALPDEEFRTRSVRLDGTDWESRYARLRELSEVWYQHERLGPVPAGVSPFARANRWVIETAMAEAAPEHLFALLVWDERPAGEGPGGTADFASQVHRFEGQLAIVNPTTLHDRTGGTP